MKRLITTSLLVVAGFTTTIFAFHDGGVARCSGCHTMHNSKNNVLVDSTNPNGNAWLLTKSSPSDVCLGCHATSNGNVLAADPMVPGVNKGGGSFVFLKEDNLNDGRAGSTPIPGERAGHNLKAPGNGLSADATLTRSPGGNYPSGVMGCSSCHDPHGTSDFRLLYGAGRTIIQGNYTFVNPAPVAVGISVGSSGGAESNSNHTAYQSGMSAWCGNCHGDFHAQSGGTKLIHPSGQNLGGTIASNYSLYNGTMSITGGSDATSYLAQVPFEDPAVTTASTNGPTASSKVMCLSCHRAHGSSAPNAGRWDFNVAFIGDDGVTSGSYAIPNPYGSASQRSLCNKCHVKDAFDAPHI